MLILGLVVEATAAFATTKGLNQIVTPDVQPFGILSLSVQQQDPNIANRYEVQAELGLTNRLEVAVFQGYSPPEQVVNSEYSLFQKILTSSRSAFSTGRRKDRGRSRIWRAAIIKATYRL